MSKKRKRSARNAPARCETCGQDHPPSDASYGGWAAIKVALGAIESHLSYDELTRRYGRAWTPEQFAETFVQAPACYIDPEKTKPIVVTQTIGGEQGWLIRQESPEAYFAWTPNKHARRRGAYWFMADQTLPGYGLSLLELRVSDAFASQPFDHATFRQDIVDRITRLSNEMGI